MERNIKKAKWISLAMGVLLFIGGIIYLQNPLEGNLRLLKAISFLTVIVGVLKIIRYFSSSYFHTGGFLIGGILDIIMGVIIFRNVAVSLLSLIMVIGVSVIANGIVQIATSLDLKSFEIDSWWLSLISGIIGVILGFIMIGNFNVSALYITYMITSHLLFTGISLVAVFFSLNRLDKRLNQ